MNPDNNQYPIDYLNQIAPQQKKPGMSNKLFFIVIGVGIVVAIIVGLFLLLGSSTGPTTSLQTLAARLQTTQKISDTSHKNLKSSTLRGTNSNLRNFLTNANRDINELLLANGLDPKKINPQIVAAESGETLLADLEDARLNAVYDNTYAREMSYQLRTIELLMNDIYERTDSESTKEFLLETNNNLQPIKAQLDEFNSTNS